MGQAKRKTANVKVMFEQANQALQAGQFEQAKQSFNQVMAAGAQSFGLFLGLGVAHLKLQEFPDALARFQQAVMLEMGNPSGHYHLGLAQESLGQKNDALQSYIRAAKLKADWLAPLAKAHALLIQAGQSEQAIPFAVQMCLLAPKEEGSWACYKQATHGLRAYHPAEEQLVPAMRQALEGSISPNLRSAILRHLHHQPWSQEFGKLSIIENHQQLREATQALIRDSDIIDQMQKGLVIPLMQRTTITQPILEVLLQQIRRYLLLEASTKRREELRPMLFAMWALCFNNEYVFEVTEEELIALSLLREEVRAALEGNENPNVLSLALLGAYTPLASEEFVLKLSQWMPEEDGVKRCLKEQVLDRIDEYNRMAALPMLEVIEDETTQKVRAQYEHAPYPRWREISSVQSTNLTGYLARSQVNPAAYEPLMKDEKQILVAGTGTGQHPIMLAKLLPDYHIQGIDISLASLAYAQRKAEEYEVKNLTLMQADILKLEKLDRQFDLIESVGVLHHMQDPVAGWKVLTSLLKPGGFMRIGLYSQIARKSVTLAREEIASLTEEVSDEVIRRYRQELLARHYHYSHFGQDDKKLLTPHIQTLLEFPDFFSLSDCRDLIFHVQEHQFTLPQIAGIVEELGLKFIGLNTFGTPELEAFAATLPLASDPAYIEKWHAYELENPATFSSMYQFWLQKPGVS